MQNRTTSNRPFLAPRGLLPQPAASAWSPRGGIGPAAALRDHRLEAGALSWDRLVSWSSVSEMVEVEPVPGWTGGAQHGQWMTLTSYEITAEAPVCASISIRRRRPGSSSTVSLPSGSTAMNDCLVQELPRSSERTSATEFARCSPRVRSSWIPRYAVPCRVPTTDPRSVRAGRYGGPVLRSRSAI